MRGCLGDWLAGLGVVCFLGGLIAGDLAVMACGGAVVTMMVIYWGVMAR